MQPSLDSPVDKSSQPFLHAWDTKARTYHQFFEIHKLAARDNVAKLAASPFTNWKDLVQKEDRYGKLDSLALRQQLGEVSDQEVSELNRVFGGNPLTGTILTRALSEPALIVGYNMLELLVIGGASLGLGAYGRFVKGYNNLWLVAPLLPLALWSASTKSRQNSVLLDNCYR